MSAYAVLEIGQDSTAEEIRRAYKKALLKHHPDKVGNKQTRYTIDDINAAFKRAMQPHGLGDHGSFEEEMIHFSDIVDLAEFDFDEDNEKFSRPCRCGEQMELRVSDLENNGSADEIAVQCTGCSLWVIVQYDVEEE